MKKTVFFISLLVSLFTLIAPDVPYVHNQEQNICYAAGRDRLDGSLPAGQDLAPVPAFIPEPSYSQVNTDMTGTITFKKGSGGTVDITNWFAIQIDPTADSTYYFNTNSTKTYPLRAGEDNQILVGRLAAGEYVTVVLGSATASVQGMRKY